MVKAVWSRCFSPINSTVAVNALYWKIQAVTRLLLSVHFHSEHFLLKKKIVKMEKKKKILYIVILIASPVTFNWYSINPLLALSFENIGIKTVLNKRLFLRYDSCLFNWLIFLPLYASVLHISFNITNQPYPLRLSVNQRASLKMWRLQSGLSYRWSLRDKFKIEWSISMQQRPQYHDFKSLVIIIYCFLVSLFPVKNCNFKLHLQFVIQTFL